MIYSYMVRYFYAFIHIHIMSSQRARLFSACHTQELRGATAAVEAAWVLKNGLGGAETPSHCWWV